MKIEIDENAQVVFVVLIVVLGAVSGGYLAYRYNSLPYELGYTEQLDTVTGRSFWVKTNTNTFPQNVETSENETPKHKNNKQ